MNRVDIFITGILAFAIAASAWADPLPQLPAQGVWAAYPNSALHPAMNAAPGFSPPPWDPQYIMDYSGGSFDPIRDEYIVWGGGHADYSGNEVCRFNRAAGAWTCGLRSDIGPNINGVPTSTLDAYADGAPAARHTYGSMAWINLGALDGFFVHGGSLSGGGWPTYGTWFYHRDTLTWEQLPSTRGLCGASDYGSTSLTDYAVWDPVRKVVHVMVRGGMRNYDPATRRWFCEGSQSEWTDGSLGHAFDAERQVFLVIGQGITQAWDTSTDPWTNKGVAITGDRTPVNAVGPGLAYDPVAKRYLAYNGGQTIWSIDRDSWVSMPLPASGADPGPKQGDGTFSRFQFVAKDYGVIVSNTIDAGVFYYQLGAPPPPPPPDPIPPTVSMTAPSNGATVSGAVAVSADASDNVSVVGVQFKLDGANLGAEAASPPYTVSWDTAKGTDGSHTLTAVARDAAGNTATAAAVAVAVSNTPPPPPPSLIAKNTWVAMPISVQNGIWPEKHVNGVYFPGTKRVYIHGGDTHAHNIQPDGSDGGGMSYQQWDKSFSLDERFADPTNVEAGQRIEVPMCVGPGLMRPKHPDYVGWVVRKGLIWHFPGLHENPNFLCPGETTVYGDDPQYRFAKIMTFDPANPGAAFKEVSANHGIRNWPGDSPWQTLYDETSDKFIRFEPDHHLFSMIAEEYDPTTDTWAYYTVAIPDWAIYDPHALFTAHDPVGRKIYFAERQVSGRASVYDIATRTLTSLGQLPGAPTLIEGTNSHVIHDKGAVIFDWKSRVLVYVEIVQAQDGTGDFTGVYRVWAAQVDTHPLVWTQIDTLPKSTLDGSAWRETNSPSAYSGTFEPDNDVVLLWGSINSNRYIWAISIDPKTLPGGPPPPPPDTTPPTVSITAPTNGAIISSQSVTVISATASDNVGVTGVQFKVDSQNLGAEDTGAPYSAAWNTALAANGIHTLTAVARDAAGNIATSTAVTVTVSNGGAPPVNRPPVVSPITANAVDVDTMTPGLQVYEGTTVTYNAAISDPDNDPLTWTWYYTTGLTGSIGGGTRVAFLSGSGTLQPAVFKYPLGSAPKTYQWILSVLDGKATSEATLNVGIVALPVAPQGGDVTAPTISISSPANNAATLRSFTVQLSGADNVGISRVELSVDGQLVQRQDFSPALPVISSQFNWKAPTAGTHALSAKAYDAAGNIGQSNTVTVKVHPPQTTAVRFTAGTMIVGLLAANQAELALNINSIPSSADFSLSPEPTDDILLEAMKRADEQGRGLTRVGAAVEIEAVDLNTLNFITNFNQPALLTAMYDPSKVKNPNLVGIFYWDESRQRWQALANPSADTVNHTVTAQTDHLTTFAVYEISPSGTASGSLEFGEVFSYPNPAKKGKATIHVELPMVDSVEIRIYDLNGNLVNGVNLGGAPTIGINGKQAYEYIWDTSGAAAGSYMYSVKASKGSQSGRILKKLAIVR